MILYTQYYPMSVILLLVLFGCERFYLETYETLLFGTIAVPKLYCLVMYCNHNFFLKFFFEK